jgi:hypothetical protein
MTTKIERLKGCPVGGPLLGRKQTAKVLGCSERKVDYLFESGRLQSFLFGKQRKTTEAAVTALTREFIDAELERLEALGADDEPRSRWPRAARSTA